MLNDPWLYVVANQNYAISANNAVGREAIEGLRFLDSLPRAGAGHEKTQPFYWIHSRLFTFC